MLAELAGNLPSGTWQKSPFWNAKETVYWEVSNLEALRYTTTWMSGEAAGHLLLQLSGTGENACATGARPQRSLVLEKLPALQNPSIGKPHTCPWSPLKPRSKVHTFCDMSLQHLLLASLRLCCLTKEKYLQGPDLFSRAEMKGEFGADSQ